jgi:hypothetical protein
MKRMTIHLMAVMAVLALSAITAATASATEKTKVLPEPTTGSPIFFTGASGPGTLEVANGEVVNCTKDTSLGAFVTANLGTFDVLFEKCSATRIIKAECTGTTAGTTKGDIPSKGTFHYWLYLLREKLGAAIVFLPTETKFICEALGQKVEVKVKGCVAGAVEPLERLGTHGTIKLAQTSNGVNEITKVLPQESTKELECKLESESSETKKEEQSSLVTLESMLGFISLGSHIEILLMN